jgi:hypothetical protein
MLEYPKKRGEVRMHRLRHLREMGLAMGLLAMGTNLGFAKSEWDYVPDGAVMTEPYNADRTDLYGLPEKPSAPPVYAVEPSPYPAVGMEAATGWEAPALVESPFDYTEPSYAGSSEISSYDWEVEDLKRLGRPLTPEEEAQLKELMATSNPP